MEQDSRETGVDGKKRLSDKFWIFLALIITVVVYLPGVNYDFLWDDNFYLTEKHMEFNPANLRYWLDGTVLDLYSPVTAYSLMIDHNLFGDSLIAYHLHSLLLHCGSVLIFIAIMKKLRISVPIAAAIAILWAIHPQRVPSLVWIAERKDILVVFFALASTYAYIAAYRKKRISIMSPLFLILSLGAKPAAIGLVIVMAVYTLWHRFTWRKIKFLIPNLIATTLYFCWFAHINKLDSPVAAGVGMLQKLWVISHNIMWYSCSGFIPFQLNPVYPRVSPPDSGYLPLTCGFLVLLIAIITGLFTVKRVAMKIKIWFIIGIGLCWGAILAPVSGIYTIGMVDFADRYNYLPSAVAWVGIAIILRQTRSIWTMDNVKKTIPAAFTVFVCFYWYMTWSYMPVWSSCENLVFRSVQWHYPNPKAIENMGILGVRENNQTLLETASQKFLTLANAGDELPFYPDQRRRTIWTQSGWFLKAYAMYLEGNQAGAFPIFIKLHKLAEHGQLWFYKNNNYSEKLYELLIPFYLGVKRPKEAISVLELQLKLLKPDSFEALFNRGLTAFIKDDFVTAVKCWEAASVMRPEDENLSKSLATARKRLSKKVLTGSADVPSALP